MAYFLLGYDVETADVELDDKVDERHLLNGRQGVRDFAEAAVRIHEELEAPCTLYFTGTTLKKYRNEYLGFLKHPLFDIQSHTYNHIRFKSVMDRTLNGESVFFQGGDPVDIAISVAQNNVLIEEIFGKVCTGVCAPWNYYRGLGDRPDLLKLLAKQGIRIIRSYGRNSEDASPVELKHQPFWYAQQGFPDMLELMSHGWIDCHYRRVAGYSNWSAYVGETKKWIDLAVEHDWDFSVCAHDWSSVLYDPEMVHTREIIAYAKAKGMILCSAADYYDEKLKKREEVSI